MDIVSNVEILMNAILSITAKDQYLIGSKAIRRIKKDEQLDKKRPNVLNWPSSFSGFQVIVNRTTPQHRDSKSDAADYDLLVSAGRHHSAWLSLNDINTRLSYQPGTVVLLCGRVLLHGVDDWEGKDRVCIAHYVRKAIHRRLRLPTHNWVEMENYLPYISSQYKTRCVNINT
jgi:hypothetical protein